MLVALDDSARDDLLGKFHEELTEMYPDQEFKKVPCDLSKPEQVADAVRKIVARFGRIDVLVNNASALYPVGVESVDEKRFDLMNHLNVRGMFLLTREVAPHMNPTCEGLQWYGGRRVSS